MDNNKSKVHRLLEKKYTDITGYKCPDCKTPEDYLQAICDHYENIIAILPNNVYWLDRNCILRGCNNNVAKLCNLPREKCIGLDYEQIRTASGLTPEQVNSFKRDDEEVMSTGRPKFNVEEPYLLDEYGEPESRYISTRVPMTNESGKVVGVVGISTDITELKKLEQKLIEAKEQAEVANQAKSNFLAIMSHELRTPLNAILGIAQILHNKDLSPSQAEYIDIILRAGDFLLTLIDDILDFSKLEAGKLEIIYQKFDFSQLAQDIVTSMRQLAENKGLELMLKYSSNAPNEMIADQQRVRQIITNLINNAIKFTDKGHVKLGITFNKRNNNFKIVVEDTGIGIPKSKQNQVFERFTQLDYKYSRKYGGAGLGLAICKQLAENMGGKIGVKSEYHKGSKFWFTLPLILKSTHVMKIKQNEIKIDDNIPLKPGNILLLEDNELNQIMFKVMLEDLGYNVAIADNGKDALKLFSKHEFDLIFSDISLPDMSGIEVIQAMRKQKNNINKPIIAVTAHALEEDRQNCLKAGADDVLIKPIMQPALKNILRKWIK